MSPVALFRCIDGFNNPVNGRSEVCPCWTSRMGVEVLNVDGSLAVIGIVWKAS